MATARKAEAVRAQLPDAGDALLAVPLDVTDPESDQAAVDAAVGRFGCIDILVNNADAGLLAAINSIVGFATAPGWGIHASTKFAVKGCTETLHAELAPLGVHLRHGACLPCPVRTRCTTSRESARNVGFPPRELRDLHVRVRAE
ncbi:SDR family NAD(P)-dependent oxidoreductase [Streptomyces acidicola]|uniref:SDR family NAD(P)-dependent oxidoreductase n=1 Tax=Streptomyces acidicola TaxID=2596892 RepID=UPI0034362A7F